MERFYRFPHENSAYLFTGPQAIFYYTGFYTGAVRPKQIGPCAVIVKGENIIMLAPQNWHIQVGEQVDENKIKLEFYSPGVKNFHNHICNWLKNVSCNEICVEFDSLGVPLYKELSERFPHLHLRDISAVFELGRFQKTKDEIVHLRNAAKLAQLGMEHAKKVIRPGVTENQVVAELEYIMRVNGSEGVPFAMKVLSGAKSAVTTFMPGEKIIEKGDLVLLDFGARSGNYASDWTRTFCVGKASVEQKKLYQTVWNIERECISMIRPGIKLCDLYAHAASMVAGTEYEKYFLPHLGHSVGINSHEAPVMEPGMDSEICLEEDMVITIEPGIYLPNFGGVRIEDDILVTADGHEILTGLKEEGLELL